MYRILDSRTGLLLPRIYKTLASAHRAADKLDAAYGAVRYVIQNA